MTVEARSPHDDGLVGSEIRQVLAGGAAMVAALMRRRIDRNERSQRAELDRLAPGQGRLSDGRQGADRFRNDFAALGAARARSTVSRNPAAR